MRAKHTPPADHAYTASVAIVGAGPVGMLAACLLGARGVDVLLLEREAARPKTSRAVGVTPPSLEIFSYLGIREDLLARGVPVREGALRTAKRRLGKVTLRGVAPGYEYVLAIPQHETEAVLEETLGRYQSVRLVRDAAVTGLTRDIDGVTLRCERAGGGARAARAFTVRAPLVAACDGANSVLREAMGIPFRGHRYRDTFLMGDYDDPTDFGTAAVLFPTRRGHVETFPLPGGQRRFVVSTPYWIPEGSSSFLAEALLARAGIDVLGFDRHWESAFGVRRFTAACFAEGRVFLAGDAAHCMSPIGGQNMNVGFGDAALMAEAFTRALEFPDLLPKLVRRYDAVRRRAARVAGRRAWLMMRLATMRGRVASGLRLVVFPIALRTPIVYLLKRIFTMRSIPGRRASLPHGKRA